MQEFVNMPLSEHNSGAGEGDRRSAGSPESSLVGEIYSRTYLDEVEKVRLSSEQPELFADFEARDSMAREHEPPAYQLRPQGRRDLPHRIPGS